MSILRNDAITGNKVIITENRANRPFDINATKRDLSKCPFCPGNEEQTPPHLFTNGLPWTIRVVPNKFPALDNEFSNDEYGLFSSESITGSHYVIIDSDKHYNYFHDMEIEELTDLLYSYSWIMDKLYEEKSTRYVQLFKNYKKEGGSSLEHTHSQVVALSFIPENVKTVLKNTEAYYNESKRCLFCEMLEKELENNSRIILDSEYFLAFAPYASMLPYEFSIFPKLHSSNFSNMTNNQYKNLSIVLKTLLAKVYTNLNNPAYNLYIQSINEEKPYFHWSIRVVPRMNIQAGFELSTGVMLNPISPEQTKTILSL